MFRQFNSIEDLMNYVASNLNDEPTNQPKKEGFKKEWEWDLPYLDKSKLKAEVGPHHLIITYNNPTDKRRNEFELKVPLRERGVKCNPDISYNEGYLRVKLNYPEERTVTVPIK